VQKTEVVLALGIGVAVGWLVLVSSPATRSLESGSIDIPMSAPPEGSLEAPAEETLEPEILLVRMAASRMPPERLQPQEEEDEEKRDRPRSRRGGDGPPLADSGVQTGSESEGQTEPVSPASSSGATTTTGGSGSSGGVGDTSGSGGGGSGSGSGGVIGGGYGGGGGGGS